MKDVMLFLFRHGETDWNAEGRFQGHLDIPLNEKGRSQALDVGARLSEANLDAIISSDLGRAVETARIVAARIGLDPAGVYQDPGIREAHLGEAQGLTLPEIRERLGSAVLSRWRSNAVTDADISYPGGETGAQVLDRVSRTLERVVTTHPEWRRIGVATHGGVIRRFIHHVIWSGKDPSREIAIPNGVVYQVIRTAAGWRLVTE